MHRRVLLIALACAVLVVGAGFLLIRSSRPDPPSEVDRPAAAVPEPEPAAAPPAAPVRPAPRAPAPAAPAAAPPPRPDVATLHVSSDVAGAQVFIDRKFVGRTPVTADNLRPGTYRLNVEAEGFDGVAETIDLEAGPRTIEVSLRQVTLDAGIDVVHRHRFGSCRGRLTATVDGLRYQPTEGDDAFAAPLSDLETFTVDYIERNLRVRLRGGRQFDFTDPEGNADRLFVFHRDVEKARARLAAGDPPAR
jgi:hypothetical protein